MFHRFESIKDHFPAVIYLCKEGFQAENCQNEIFLSLVIKVTSNMCSKITILVTDQIARIFINLQAAIYHCLMWKSGKNRFSKRRQLYILDTRYPLQICLEIYTKQRRIQRGSIS